LNIEGKRRGEEVRGQRSEVRRGRVDRKGAKVAKGRGGRRGILNFKFWILNRDEGEEVAFCCDLRSMIHYL
jgi:hypothetical protein